MTWKVMQRNAWTDVANLRIKQLSNETKSQLHALTTINLKKKKFDQLENCPQFARKLFWNVHVWHVLVDLIFYGHLLVRWRSGQKLVINVWRVWSLTFITHVHTGNVVMWENTGQQCRLGLFQDRNSVHFRKSHVRANKLDVQETDFCFTQFYRSWGDFSRCRFTHGWFPNSRSLGFGDVSNSFVTKPNQQNQRCCMSRLWVADRSADGALGPFQRYCSQHQRAPLGSSEEARARHPGQSTSWSRRRGYSVLISVWVSSTPFVGSSL